VARTGVAEHWVFDVQEMRELPVDRGHARRSLLGSLREALGRTLVLFYASPSGEAVVAVQYSGRSAVVWDLSAGRPLGSWPASQLSVPVRLADGEHVTVPLRLAKEDPDLRGSGLRPLGNPRTAHAARGESDRLEATPTGRFLRVNFVIGPGRVQSVTLAGHSGAVTSYDFLPDADGYVVVTASRDGTVRRWEIQPGKTRQAADGAEAVANREALAVSRIVCAELPSGASVGVASDANGGVAVWDLRTGHLIGDVSEFGTATAIGVAQLKGELVGVVAAFDVMRFMRLPHGAVTHWRGDRQWWPNDIAGVSLPDGSDVIVTTGHSRKSVVWDLGTGRMRRVLGAHRGWTSCVAHAPGARTGSVVLTGGFDNRVNAWDLSRWWHRRFRVVKLPAFLAYPSSGHARAIRTARLPDGKVLVLVATLDGMVRALEAPETMRHVRRTGAIAADTVTSATLTNGLLVVITATDGIVRVWDAAKFPPASGTLPLCAVNIDVPVTDLDATEHDTVVLATPNGLTAIRLDAGLLMDQAAYSAPG